MCVRLASLVAFFLQSSPATKVHFICFSQCFKRVLFLLPEKVIREEVATLYANDRKEISFYGQIRLLNTTAPTITR
jgi:hypothetical protein